MNFRSIISHPAVRTLRTAIHERDRETVEEQLLLTSIPAPTGQESERADYIKNRFLEIGLETIHSDDVGNVLALLPRPSRRSAQDEDVVIVAAHLDTVFPPGTDTQPRRVRGRYYAPGITDNARGLAALLAIASVLREHGATTKHPILFIATVGEEGLGDLRGVKHLFRDGSPYRSALAFISLDGAGLGRIVHRAIGSCRIRATFRGPGGHSWGDRGLANPAHALGIAIAALRELRPPSSQNFTVNVGRIGGGTSVNAVPSKAWLELDLRSENAHDLQWLESEACRILEAAVRTETNSSSRKTALALDMEKIGDRPGGMLPADAPLLDAAIAATRLLGTTPELAASSTDANVPLSLGIPAITIGAGGRGEGVHTTEEWFENHDGALGIERALLTLLAVAGFEAPA